jgi:hypothetical protein
MCRNIASCGLIRSKSPPPALSDLGLAHSLGVSVLDQTLTAEDRK